MAKPNPFKKESIRKRFIDLRQANLSIRQATATLGVSLNAYYSYCEKNPAFKEASDNGQEVFIGDVKLALADAVRQKDNGKLALDTLVATQPEYQRKKGGCSDCQWLEQIDRIHDPEKIQLLIDQAKEIQKQVENGSITEAAADAEMIRITTYEANNP